MSLAPQNLSPLLENERDHPVAGIALAPSEKNNLIGTAATALPAKPKGAVQLTAPDGKTATARFD